MTEESAPANKRNDNLLLTGVRKLTRLILVLLLGIALGVVVFLTYAFVLQDLVLRPAESMQEQLTIAETSQAKAQENVNDRLSQYNERITALESQHDLDMQTLSELQTDLDALQTALQNQDEVISRIETMESALTEMLTEDKTLLAQIEENGEEIASIQATVQAANQTSTAALLREVQLLHALELLDRSRLYLLQQNFGLAEQDILSAGEVLLLIHEDAPKGAQEILADWVERLDAIAGSLPNAPDQAAIDLEIVWNMMINGLDGGDFSSGSTPLELTPQSDDQPEQSPESDPTVTPTPKS